MIAKSAMEQYGDVATNSVAVDASPHAVIQSVFEELLARVSEAKGLMQRGEIALKGKKISSAIDVVGGLRGVLDFEAGGEVAVELDSIYEYVSRQLVQANVKNDPAILDEVSALIGKIKDGWDSMPDDARELNRETMGKMVQK